MSADTKTIDFADLVIMARAAGFAPVRGAMEGAEWFGDTRALRSLVAAAHDAGRASALAGQCEATGSAAAPQPVAGDWHSAFEAHRIAQGKIFGMPGLKAGPCFKAGWDSACAQQQAAPAGRLAQAQIDYIGEQWDGCMYAAADGDIDIGACLRRELTLLANLGAPAGCQALSKPQIKAIFLANGFTIKPGEVDLKRYVYAAGQALLDAAMGRKSGPAPVKAVPRVSSPPGPGKDGWMA